MEVFDEFLNETKNVHLYYNGIIIVIIIHTYIRIGTNSFLDRKSIKMFISGD